MHRREMDVHSCMWSMMLCGCTTRLSFETLKKVWHDMLQAPQQRSNEATI